MIKNKIFLSQNMKNKKKINKKEEESVQKLLDSEKLEKLERFLHPEKAKYDFLQDSEEEEITEEIDFDGLINLSKKDLGKINIEKFTEENDGIIFFCKTCKQEVMVSRLPSKNKKLVKFQCNECQGGDILYGTTRGVKEYYERKQSK